MRTMLRNLSHWEFAKLGFFLFINLTAALIFILTPSLLPSTLLSILLFFIFSPFIDAMERKGISRTHAILAVFLVCGLIIITAATRVIPRVTNELDTFQKGSSAYLLQITKRLKTEERKICGLSVKEAKK